MAYQEIIYGVQDGVATLALNRPDKLNAWTPTMEQEVLEALTSAEQDDNVRVIIFTGAGRGFCAGADMGSLSSVASGEGGFAAVEERLREKFVGPKRPVRRPTFKRHTPTCSTSRSPSWARSTAPRPAWAW